MRYWSLAPIAVLCLAASACTTTQEAATAVQSRWIGQPASAFFTRYGPPQSDYNLPNGDIIHTWRGGETTRTIPAQYSNPAPPKLPSFPTFGSAPQSSGFGNSSWPSSGTFGGNAHQASSQPLWSKQTTRTETKVENPSPGVTRTTTVTKSSGASIGWNPPWKNKPHGGGDHRRLIAPARTEQLFCELQITADPQDIIKSIRISRDTTGAGMALSRCAEVLDVK
ncbi:hypothetical protein [Jiella sp. M17.18]|uniref:hypothetical protein n=1 Tax=Jiella sp. M17.18 TaxID=3234247 RepID=UPI0034DF237B